MKDLILQDETYRKDMKESVGPYLAARAKEYALPRGEEKKLHVVRYLADAPAGTAVLSHGFTETAEKYKESVYYFLKKGFHVYIMDHCGHGQSYRLVEDDLSLVHVDRYERYVKDLLAVAHLAKKEQPDLPLYLYGHSMGGGVAAAALAAEPKLFCKAVLSSPMIRPLTGPVPWPVAKAIVGAACLAGRGKSYVPGQHAFDASSERFETSPSTGRERYDEYQEKRVANPLYQMSAPSCGWLREAARLNRHLLGSGWQKIETPFLLFQSESDSFVSNAAQDAFVARIQKEGKTEARIVRIKGSRHEIFNSPTEVVQGYWQEIFDFLLK